MLAPIDLNEGFGESEDISCYIEIDIGDLIRLEEDLERKIFFCSFLGPHTHRVSETGERCHISNCNYNYPLLFPTSAQPGIEPRQPRKKDVDRTYENGG